MTNVKLGSKTYENVKAVKLDNVDGGTSLFNYTASNTIVYGDTPPEDTSKLWVKVPSAPNDVTMRTIKGEVTTVPLPEGMEGFQESNASNSQYVFPAADDDINDALFYMYCYSRHENIGRSRVGIVQINKDYTAKLLAIPVDEPYDYHNKYNIHHAVDTADTLYILLGFDNSDTSGKLKQFPQYIWPFNKKTNTFGTKLYVSAACNSCYFHIAAVDDNILVYGSYKQTSSSDLVYVIYKTNKALTSTITQAYSQAYSGSLNGEEGFVYNGKLYTDYKESADDTVCCIFDKTGAKVGTWEYDIADKIDEHNWVHGNLVITMFDTSEFRALDMETNTLTVVNGEYTHSFGGPYVYAIKVTDEAIYANDGSISFTDETQIFRRYPIKSNERNTLVFTTHQPMDDLLYFDRSSGNIIDAGPVGGAFTMDDDGYYYPVEVYRYIDGNWTLIQ